MELLPSRNKENQPPLLFAEAAQNIYNCPKDARAIADELHEKLIRHYSDTGMSQKEGRIERARYLELRGPWNALVAPLFHAIEIELIDTILPLSVSRGLLAPPELINEPTHDKSFGQPYAGPELSIMRAITRWSVAVTEWFWEDVQRIPGHWARSVLDALAVYHSPFCEAESMQKGGWKRSAHPLDAILELAIDSSETAMAALMPLVKHNVDNDEGWLSKDRARVLLTQTEQLSWASSVTRDFLGDYLGRQGQVQKANPFSAPGHGNLWRLASLKNGPWPVPRYCPANIPLVSPFGEERMSAHLATGGSYLTFTKESGVSAARLRLMSLTHILNEVELLHPSAQVVDDYAYLKGRSVPSGTSLYDFIRKV